MPYIIAYDGALAQYKTKERADRAAEKRVEADMKASGGIGHKIKTHHIRCVGSWEPDYEPIDGKPNGETIDGKEKVA
jgi:hypothetical protein